jgi:hypothetical protein
VKLAAILRNKHTKTQITNHILTRLGRGRQGQGIALLCHLSRYALGCVRLKQEALGFSLEKTSQSSTVELQFSTPYRDSKMSRSIVRSCLLEQILPNESGSTRPSYSDSIFCILIRILVDVCAHDTSTLYGIWIEVTDGRCVVAVLANSGQWPVAIFEAEMKTTNAICRVKTLFGFVSQW